MRRNSQSSRSITKSRSIGASDCIIGHPPYLYETAPPEQYPVHRGAPSISPHVKPINLLRMPPLIGRVHVVWYIEHKKLSVRTVLCSMQVAIDIKLLVYRMCPFCIRILCFSVHIFSHRLACTCVDAGYIVILSLLRDLDVSGRLLNRYDQLPGIGTRGMISGRRKRGRLPLPRSLSSPLCLCVFAHWPTRSLLHNASSTSASHP